MRIDRIFAQDRVFLTALFILLTVIVGSLFYLTAQQQQTMEGIPAAVLTRLDLTPLNQDLPAGLVGHYRRFENEIRTEFSSIRAVYLSINRDGRSYLIYPPFQKNYPDDAISLPLESGGRIVGQLHLVLDSSRLNILRLTAWGSALVSILVYMGIFIRSRTQERSIAETRSELARKQEEIIRLERLAMVGQLSGAILHDLRKPVLNIREEASQMPADDPVAAGIREQADLFFQIIRETDLESLMRRDSAREEYLDVADVVQRSVRLVSYQSDGAVFDVRLDEDLPPLLGVKHRLIQVFSNLLLNALQATDGKGEIRITASVASSDGQEWLDIAFSDNGPGIDESIRERIFEPLFSGGTGTGLGLYIVRSILTEMDGRVEVRSRSGAGTTFVVSFPVRD